MHVCVHVRIAAADMGHYLFFSLRGHAAGVDRRGENGLREGGGADGKSRGWVGKIEGEGGSVRREGGILDCVWMSVSAGRCGP